MKAKPKKETKPTIPALLCCCLYLLCFFLCMFSCFPFCGFFFCCLLFTSCFSNFRRSWSPGSPVCLFLYVCLFFSVFAVSFAFSVAFSFSVLLCSNWFCFFKIVGCFSLLLLLAFPQKVVRFSCALVFAFFIFSSLEVGLRHFTKLAKARYSAYYQNQSNTTKAMQFANRFDHCTLRLQHWKPASRAWPGSFKASRNPIPRSHMIYLPKALKAL